MKYLAKTLAFLMIANTSAFAGTFTCHDILFGPEKIEEVKGDTVNFIAMEGSGFLRVDTCSNSQNQKLIWLKKQQREGKDMFKKEELKNFTLTQPYTMDDELSERLQRKFPGKKFHVSYCASDDFYRQDTTKGGATTSQPLIEKINKKNHQDTACASINFNDELLDDA